MLTFDQASISVTTAWMTTMIRVRKTAKDKKSLFSENPCSITISHSQLYPYLFILQFHKLCTFSLQ